MIEERIIIEFRAWQYNSLPVEDAVEFEEAVKDGDYAKVAEYLKIQDAYDIRIETKDAGWR